VTDDRSILEPHAPRQPRGLRSQRRALYAAGLLTALTGALLAAWFVAGWADVRVRQSAVREGPRLAAEQRGAELARDLRGELGTLLAREVERPYFHYQNLFRDPRASAGQSVAPSPLAQSPAEGLVLGYFQLDATGRATTPTVNDELPELSEPTRLADHRRFRDEVRRSLVAELAPRESPVVASLEPRPPDRPITRPPPRRAAPSQAPPPPATPPPDSTAGPETQAQQSEKQSKVVTLDSDTYVQNRLSNAVYLDQQRADTTKRAAPNDAPKEPDAAKSTARTDEATGEPGLDGTRPPASGTTDAATSTPSTDGSTTRAGPEPAATQQPAAPSSRDVAPGHAIAEPRLRRVPVATSARPVSSRDEPTAPITITVSPLEWRTLGFAGQPAIVAVRHVDTPDGPLSQGFVIDRTALTSWLAEHAADAVAELRTGEGGTTEIAPGWYLEVSPNPRAMTAAAADATAVARGFLVRFIAVGAVAILAALLVVMLVVRAERLARERSQFAAAAAHELRTPLAGLQLYGDMLADGLGDPGKTRDYARRMSEEASRLGRVVSNVLGFSQLERGNLSVDPQVGALGEVLRELVERAQPALDRAGVALALDVAPELTARFDRDALTRIIGNLLDNAEKYSRGADDRTITLAARAAGSTVEVAISDHGPGIAQQARARLFQPFARGVSADGPAGLGLGLALSQSLARAMGGELVYRSSPDGGATFVLTLVAG
jgi:signal transduction histidine kinase